MRRDAFLEELRPADHQQQALTEHLMELGRYQEAEPENLEEISDHGEVAPRSANDDPSDGMSLSGVLSGAIGLVVVWAVCLVTF